MLERKAARSALFRPELVWLHHQSGNPREMCNIAGQNRYAFLHGADPDQDIHHRNHRARRPESKNGLSVQQGKAAPWRYYRDMIENAQKFVSSKINPFHPSGRFAGTRYSVR